MKLRSETSHGVERRSALKERSHEAGPVARATFRRAAWQGAASLWIPQKSRSAPGFGGVFWISWESLQLIKASWRRVGELKRRKTKKIERRKLNKSAPMWGKPQLTVLP